MYKPITYYRVVSSILVLLSVIIGVHAAPLIALRQGITTLTSDQIANFKPYTYFASAGYCSPTTTLNWTCGASCQANPSFIPVASGGDGDNIQYWFVGYNPTSEEVIVSHQGTDTSYIYPLVEDVNAILEPLNPSLFPGISRSIEVHSGFAGAQAITAGSILQAVQTAMNQNQATKVTIVGHSLGAAIALLDSVYLPLYLPSSTTFRTITYGMPRVGNQDFANYIDANTQLTRINNEEDPIPIVPGMFLGFVHPAGEIHIQDSGTWAGCPGQDNPSTECTVGDVPDIFYGNLSDHDGPYDGVTMGAGC